MKSESKEANVAGPHNNIQTSSQDDNSSLFASAAQSRYTCVTNTGPGFDDMTMVIDQMAAEINETENRLRHFLIERIEAGNSNEAAEMLRDWSSMAAGDVLNKYTKRVDVQA